MSKIYRGELRLTPDMLVLFRIRSDGESQLVEQLKAAHQSPLDFSLSREKYFLTLSHHPSASFSVLKFLESLDTLFPQIVWTKVIKDEHGVKIEFIPVPFHLKSQGLDGQLADCLTEMGNHEDNPLPAFKLKVEEVFRRNNGEQEISLTPTHVSLELRLKLLQLKVQELAPQISEEVEEQAEEEELPPTKKREAPKPQAQGPRKKKLFFLLGGALSLALFLIIFVQFYSLKIVSGVSMSPTLKNNQVLFLENQPKQVKRNDLVSFSVPQMAQKEFVKRVVALEGDTVYASGGDLYVNDMKVEKQYSSQFTDDFSLEEMSGRERVPAHKVFVLGDNRAHSTDSRNFGFIDITDINGKVLK